MRWLGSLPILLIALSCSGSSDPERAPAAAGGGASSGGSGQGATASGGSPIVAPNLGDPGDCCSAREERGCDNAAVQQCVCAVQTFCCSSSGAWDTACVRAVDELGCGICPNVETTSDQAGAGGEQPMDQGGSAGSMEQPVGQWSSCCEKQPHAGCGDTDVEARVCEVDAYCCEKKWDRYCAVEAQTLGGAVCTTFDAGGGGAGGQGG